MVVEEARRLPARLVVYRESPTRQVYEVSPGEVRFLRRASDTSIWSPLLTRITLLFNADRGPDATVDLDLIIRAADQIRGPALFHDQFAGLTGFLRHQRTGADYGVYVHETALGDQAGVMDQTLRVPGLSALIRSYDRAILRTARVVLTNSRRNQQILDRAGIPSTVSYPGCEPLDALPPGRERFLLAVAVWERTKRPEVYAELARRTGVPVVLAGMWGRPEEMEAFRRRHPGVVRITGRISEQELDRLSRTAALYVRFGFGERGPGQGGIQALAYGMPVLTNPELAVAEVITEGRDGFVVRDVDAAAARVADLFESSQRLSEMSEAAWEKSRTLSWDAHARQVRAALVGLRRA